MFDAPVSFIPYPGFQRHLIADHLGWFKDATEGGKLKNVEDIMRAKGEEVKRMVESGVLEALE
jgi:protein import protein ZIM17